MALTPALTPALTLTATDGSSYSISRACLTPSHFLSTLPEDEHTLKITAVPPEYLALTIALLKRRCGEDVPLDYNLFDDDEKVSQYVTGYFGVKNVKLLLVEGLAAIDYSEADLRNTLVVLDTDDLKESDAAIYRALVGLEDERVGDHFSFSTGLFVEFVVEDTYQDMTDIAVSAVVKGLGYQAFLLSLRELAVSKPHATYSDLYLDGDYLEGLVRMLRDLEDNDVELTVDRFRNLLTEQGNDVYVSGVRYWIEKYRRG